MKYGELKSKILLVLTLGTMANMSSVYAAGPLVITKSDTVTQESGATYTSDTTTPFGISFSQDGTNERTYTLKSERLEAKGSQAGIGVAGDTLVVQTTQDALVEGKSSGIYVGWANSPGITTYPDFPTSGIENTPKSSVTIQSQGNNEIRQIGRGTSDISAGISLQGDVTFALESTSGNNTVKSAGGHGLLVGTTNNPTVGEVTVTAGKSNTFTGALYGIQAMGTSGMVSSGINPNESDSDSMETGYLGAIISLRAGKDNVVSGETAGILLTSGPSLSLQAGGTNRVTGENTGATNKTYSKLNLYGNSIVQGNLYGLWTDAKADTVINGNGGTIQVDALKPYFEREETVDDGNGGSMEIFLRSPAAAVVSMTGGATTLKGGTVTISGTNSLVAAHSYSELSNVYGGSGGGDDTGIWENPDDFGTSTHSPEVSTYASSVTDSGEDRASSITLNYGKDSSITGDMYAYDDGTITIAPEDGGTIAITGNIIATGIDDVVGGEEMSMRAAEAGDGYIEGMTDSTKGGTITITLCDGSTLTGWADTGTLVKDSLIPGYPLSAGTLNLLLDAGSVWTMTGHSTVTTLGGNGGTVYYENGGDALEIGTLAGSHTFALDLDADDGSNSDMIYIVNGTSDAQTLVVKNLTTLDGQMDVGEAVRFATVQNSQNEFVDGSQVAVVASGLYNDKFHVEYRTVASDSLNTDAYNNAYNGDGSRKPTTEYVETNFGGDNTQNVYLVKSQNLNKGAIMPANVSHILWRHMTDLDTFTNRTGESQYFTPNGNEGGWIRLNYSNLGIDEDGELDGNTYELGWTQVLKNTDDETHRFSVSAAYSKQNGRFEGYRGDFDLRDFSLNLYDTHEYYKPENQRSSMPSWRMDDHNYWDSYIKYHRANVDYKAIDSETGLDYVGGYHQNVVNMSTEYGWKRSLSDTWSFVPQTQLQFSYFGNAHDVDSQGLSYDMDHGWSLVGRIGFDLVKKTDLTKDSTFYIKASLLHEFLDGPDVDVWALGDTYHSTGTDRGTWGVIGLGYSEQIGPSQTLYVDYERYVGHDFSRTYTVRAGLNWKF